MDIIPTQALQHKGPTTFSLGDDDNFLEGQNFSNINGLIGWDQLSRPPAFFSLHGRLTSVIPEENEDPIISGAGSYSSTSSLTDKYTSNDEHKSVRGISEDPVISGAGSFSSTSSLTDKCTSNDERKSARDISEDPVISGAGSFSSTSSLTDKLTSKDEPKSARGISEEVKKLGLTANVISDLNTFDPYWIETKSIKGGRRHSTGLTELTNGEADPRLPKGYNADLNESFLELNNKYENYLGEKRSTYMYRRQSSGVFKPIRIGDMQSTLSIRGKTTKKDSNTLDTTVSHLKNVNDNWDSPDMYGLSESDLFQNIPRVSGGIFRATEGLKHSSSAGCLQKIKKIFTNEFDSQDKVKEKSVRIQSNEKKGLRRTQSSSSIQTKSSEEDNSLVKTTNSEDIKTLKRGRQIRENKDDSYKWIESSSNENHEFPDNEHDHTVRERYSSLGKKSVEWATTKKVRSSKRERNMFSPTSF